MLPQTKKVRNKTMKKSDLKPINNLKVITRDIRAYLAGNATGITRDEVIVQNLMLLVISKIYDEQHNENLMFYKEKSESDTDLFTKISVLFMQVKREYPDTFNPKETITLAEKDLSYVVLKLQDYSLMDSERDVVADVFEELIGVAFRGGEGQFFTPKNVVRAMVEMADPKAGEKIADPACGSAGFLVYAYLYSKHHGVEDCTYFGIEKDSSLAKISRMYLAVLGLNPKTIACENSLVKPEEWKTQTRKNFGLEKFDLIITNPPFGAKIPITDSKILEQYNLGHVWTRNKKKEWSITDKLTDKQPPQILFIERIIQLLKKGGRAGIVLPDGVFGNPSDRYIWEYVRSVCRIDAVVSLTQEAFQPSTHTKTSILFVTKCDRKELKKPYNIFMSIINKVGHDKNGKELYKYKLDGTYELDESGNKIIDDEIPLLIDRYHKYVNGELGEGDKYGFVVSSEDIHNNVYIPTSYFGSGNDSLSEHKYDFVTVGELVEDGDIVIKRGFEIGSKFYGTGDIPFVRTSDIVNWEIKADPIKSISEEAYQLFRKRQNIKVGDILFVNDGTFLIGRSAMVTESSLKCVIQSHLRKISVMPKSRVNAYYLFYLLNTKFVQKQIKSKTFVQATISTIGDRLEEVVLPISKNKKEVEAITEHMKKIFEEKESIKKRMNEVMNVDFPDEE